MIVVLNLTFHYFSPYSILINYDFFSFILLIDVKHPQVPIKLKKKIVENPIKGNKYDFYISTFFLFLKIGINFGFESFCSYFGFS